MNIYASSKPMPYVYMGIHKTTNQIYIGYRERNVKHDRTSSSDLGNLYFTSSPAIQETFDKFNWVIVAEFFDPTEAYWFEQSLIEEHWNNPLLLNKQFYSRATSLGMFRHTGRTTGFTGRKHSDDTKKKMSISLSTETKNLISEKVSGKNHPNYGKKLSNETCKKISESRKRFYELNPPGPSEKKGTTLSEEHKRKMSESSKIAWAKRKEKS